MSHPFSDECLENWVRGDFADASPMYELPRVAAELLEARRRIGSLQLTIDAMARHAQELDGKLDDALTGEQRALSVNLVQRDYIIDELSWRVLTLNEMARWITALMGMSPDVRAQWLTDNKPLHASVSMPTIWRALRQILAHYGFTPETLDSGLSVHQNAEQK